MTTEEQRTDGQAADQDEALAAAPAKKRTTRRRTTAAKGEAKTAKPRSTGKRAGEAAAASASGDKRPARRRRTTRAAAAEDGQRPAPRLPRLLERLRTEVGPAMVKEFGYTSSMQVPRLDKVVLNIGMGESLENARAMEAATKDLSLISGQRSVSGSLVGSPSTASRMLEFANLHSIVPVIERFRFDQVNEAIEKLHSGDVRYRIVLENNL